MKMLRRMAASPTTIGEWANVSELNNFDATFH